MNYPSKGHGSCLPFDMQIWFAYIDGGSGSLLIQALIAGVLGAAATIKVFWSQIKLKFFGAKPKVDDD